MAVWRCLQLRLTRLKSIFPACLSCSKHLSSLEIRLIRFFIFCFFSSFNFNFYFFLYLLHCLFFNFLLLFLFSQYSFSLFLSFVFSFSLSLFLSLFLSSTFFLFFNFFFSNKKTNKALLFSISSLFSPHPFCPVLPFRWHSPLLFLLLLTSLLLSSSKTKDNKDCITWHNIARI